MSGSGGSDSRKGSNHPGSPFLRLPREASGHRTDPLLHLREPRPDPHGPESPSVSPRPEEGPSLPSPRRLLSSTHRRVLLPTLPGETVPPDHLPRPSPTPDTDLRREKLSVPSPRVLFGSTLLRSQGRTREVSREEVGERRPNLKGVLWDSTPCQR